MRPRRILLWLSIAALAGAVSLCPVCAAAGDGAVHEFHFSGRVTVLPALSVRSIDSAEIVPLDRGRMRGGMLSFRGRADRAVGVRLEARDSEGIVLAAAPLAAGGYTNIALDELGVKMVDMGAAEIAKLLPRVSADARLTLCVDCD